MNQLVYQATIHVNGFVTHILLNPSLFADLHAPYDLRVNFTNFGLDIPDTINTDPNTFDGTINRLGQHLVQAGAPDHNMAILKGSNVDQTTTPTIILPVVDNNTEIIFKISEDVNLSTFSEIRLTVKFSCVVGSVDYIITA
jgi:hypothetical protein